MVASLKGHFFGPHTDATLFWCRYSDMVVLFDRHPKFLSQVLQSCYRICYIDVQISIISKGSMQNKFSVKVGILAQGGGGGLTQSQLLQITVFMAYLTLFCRKFPKNSRKKSQRSGRGGEVKPVGPNSQLLPKICFASSP